LNRKIRQIVDLPALEAAPQLLGCILVRELNGTTLKLEIVETEAYHQDDPASHSFRGNTARTAPMFEKGGHIYVYFTYGMHYCINIVTGPVGRGEAVLIRAAQPIAGIEVMRANRGIEDIKNLSNGPGKLAQALGITDTTLSGKILDKSSIYLEPPARQIGSDNITTTPRIGISKAADQPWRFYIKDNPFVSRYTAVK
jgi:DNA-3-methyladenine glycosylase